MAMHGAADASPFSKTCLTLTKSRTNSGPICGTAPRGIYLKPRATPGTPRAASSNWCRKRRRWRGSPNGFIRVSCVIPSSRRS